MELQEARLGGGVKRGKCREGAEKQQTWVFRRISYEQWGTKNACLRGYKSEIRVLGVPNAVMQ